MSGCSAYFACVYDSGLLIIITLSTVLTYIEGFNEHNNTIDIGFYFISEFLAFVNLGLIFSIFTFGSPVKFRAYSRYGMFVILRCIKTINSSE
jgi:hypothetical protein